MITIAVNLGPAVQYTVSSDYDQTRVKYAAQLIHLFKDPTATSIVSYVLISLLSGVLFIPFSGISVPSLIAVDDLSGVRPARAHRYFDSLLLVTGSALPLTQLVLMTSVTSMVTFTGQRFAAFTLTFLLWVLTQIATATGSWVVEWVSRRFGRRTRWTWVSVLAVTGATAVILDPHHGATLFGLGPKYTEALRASTVGNSTAVIVTAALAAAAVVLMLLVGVRATVAALDVRPPSATIKQAGLRYRSLGASPLTVALSLLGRALWRTRSVNRSLPTVLTAGLLMAVMVHNPLAIVSTFAVIVPMTVALGFGSNVFAILGEGMPWLGSQPRLMRALLPAALIIETAVTFILSGTLLVVAVVVGNLPVGRLGMSLALNAATGFGIVGVALALSVFRPFRAPMRTRSDTLLPPLTVMGYTLALGLVATAAPVIYQMAPESLLLVRAIAATALIGCVSLCFAFYSWDKDRRHSKVIATVGPQ